MTTFYLTCAAIGGVLLLAQLVLGAVGAGHHDVGTHDAPSDGLHLLSVRAISAGVAFFGIGGLALASLGLPALVSMPVALLAGLLSMIGVAMLMRSMLGLQRDATVRIDSAIGLPATVYVPVPAALGGTGKVLLALNGRTVEYQAVTADAQPLPTGTAVLVVDVRDEQTVEVVLPPSVDGLL